MNLEKLAGELFNQLVLVLVNHTFIDKSGPSPVTSQGECSEENNVMSVFYLNFRDSDPTLSETQVAEYQNLDDATKSVIIAMRDIVSDHIRHSRPLTMTSVTISDEGRETLCEITVADVLADLLPGVKMAMKQPPAANEKASISNRNGGFRVEMKRD